MNGYLSENLTVSRETRAFLEVMVSFDNLFEDFSDALENLYGDSVEKDKEMDKEFVGKFIELRSIMEKYLVEMINYKLYWRDGELSEILTI